MKQKIILYLILMGSFFSLSAQNGIVKGVVTSSEDGLPLPGATVMIAGTKIGASTDFDGKYTLGKVDKDATLIFSFTGFANQSIKVNGQETINVSLKAESMKLNEVVVTGYSKERKVDLTGAVTVVELKPIMGQSLSSGNTMDALQGRVAGLNIEKSGDPSGASSRILIRGVSTLGSSNPLYVIDGVPVERPEIFASLNPSIIESIQVLKDASASSVYGSRAANGVIIVTTKSAVKGQAMSVSYGTNVSMQSEKKSRYKMLNALDRGKVLWQASVNDGADPSGGYGQIYNFDWNQDISNPVLNSVSVKPFVGGDTGTPAGDTDWQDTMYKTGILINNDLSISGGSDKINSVLNIGYLDNSGMLKYTNYERYTARLNSNFKLFNDKVKIGVNSQFTQSNERSVANDVGGARTTGLAITLAPTIPVYKPSGDFGGPLGSGYSDRNNPLLMQYLNRWDNSKKISLMGNIFAEINLLKNLTFRSSIGMDSNSYARKDIEPFVHNGSVNRTEHNSLTMDTNKYSSLTISNTLNYNLKISEHKIGVIVGNESVKTDFSTLVGRAEDFAVESESYFVLSAGTGAKTTFGKSFGTKLLSTFGKFNYSFSDKYLASFTIRRDGSSKFGENNRYGIFPAVTAGWRINNENFFKKIEVVSNLKLRAGYGEVGNQNIDSQARFGLYESRYGPNQNVYFPDFFNIYYNVGTAYDLNGTGGQLPSGYVSIQAANPNLKWETTKETNVGIDFGFFSDKLTGSFDYFSRHTEGILITPPIASAVGEGQQRFVNGASTANKGWELTLGYAKTFTNGLYFNVTTNFGATKNKVTKLPVEVRTAYAGTAQNSIIGHSQFEVFGYKTDGLFQSQEDIDSHATQNAINPSRLGGIKYVDINADGVVDFADRTWIGSTLPKLEYGINVSLAYKNIDFSVFGSGVSGRIGLDPYIFWNNAVQGRDNAGPGTLNAWTPTNTSSTIPSLSLVHNDNQTSDYLFRNNSYFKFRNIQLGYTLPDSIVSKSGFITKCRIYAQGENLFWITPKGYIGSDPERTDVNRIPVPKTFTLAVNFNF